MQFILRDWDRTWCLAFSSEAKRCPGTPIKDDRSALSTLSRLIHVGANLSVIRGFFSCEPFPGARIIPTQAGPLLMELERRLARRNCVLLQGAPYVLKSGAKGGPEAAAAAAPLEAWNFAPEDLPTEERPIIEEPPPVLRFSGASEESVPLRFAHGAEKSSGMSFAHGSESDAGFSFAGGAESPQGLDFSDSVKAPV